MLEDPEVIEGKRVTHLPNQMTARPRRASPTPLDASLMIRRVFPMADLESRHLGKIQQRQRQTMLTGFVTCLATILATGFSG